MPRYAIYFTPRPLTPLARFGAAVIGYDSSDGADVPHCGLNGVSLAELAAATEAPRRYGFHATLMAPFHLDGRPESELLQALKQFCDRIAPVRLGTLQVSMLGNFIALRPSMDETKLNELANCCVKELDPFRASLNAADFARRRTAHLSRRQRAYLDRWGYPYVFEEFRFHMTLAGSLEERDQARFFSALSNAYQPLAADDLELDSLSLMRQKDSSSRFQVVARHLLCASRQVAGN